MKVYIVLEIQDSGHEEVWRVSEDEADACKYATDMNNKLNTNRYVVDEWDTFRCHRTRHDIARSIHNGPGKAE